jgi:hypothetical protein
MKNYIIKVYIRTDCCDIYFYDIIVYWLVIIKIIPHARYMYSNKKYIKIFLDKLIHDARNIEHKILKYIKTTIPCFRCEYHLC